MFMRYLFLSVILSFILFSGCRGKKDFITYVKGKKVIRKTIVKNYDYRSYKVPDTVEQIQFLSR